MPLAADPVRIRGLSILVSNAAASFVPSGRLSSHSRSRGSTVGSGNTFFLSSVPTLRVAARLIPCACVGPPTTRRSNSAVSAGVILEIGPAMTSRSEEHTSELQSPYDLVCRLLLEKKNEHTCLSHHHA